MTFRRARICSLGWHRLSPKGRGSRSKCPASISRDLGFDDARCAIARRSRSVAWARASAISAVTARRSTPVGHLQDFRSRRHGDRDASSKHVRIGDPSSCPTTSARTASERTRCASVSRVTRSAARLVEEGVAGEGIDHHGRGRRRSRLSGLRQRSSRARRHERQHDHESGETRGGPAAWGQTASAGRRWSGACDECHDVRRRSGRFGIASVQIIASGEPEQCTQRARRVTTGSSGVAAVARSRDAGTPRRTRPAP